jgi:hypothetical protein
MDGAIAGLFAGVPVSDLDAVADGPGMTGSVASAPCTALFAAAVTSISAIGFMYPSIGPIAINLNHESGVAIS